MERDAGLLQGTLDETVKQLQDLLKESEACKGQLNDELALLSVCLNPVVDAPLTSGMTMLVAFTPQAHRRLSPFNGLSIEDTVFCCVPSFCLTGCTSLVLFVYSTCR